VGTPSQVTGARPRPCSGPVAIPTPIAPRRRPRGRGSAVRPV